MFVDKKIPIVKKSIFFFLLVIALLSSACDMGSKRASFNAETFVAPYKLIVPEKWTTETFNIPIDFAPSIKYSGIEEVRFAPGWDSSEAEDYWTYAYLWYVSGVNEFDVEIIEENLEAYYTGLVERNIKRRKIPKEKVFPVTAKFTAAKAQDGDLGAFSGTVQMLDYMAQQPITLNFIVHIKRCHGQDSTIVFYKISPQPTTHPVWQTLNTMWTEFQCQNK